MSRESRSRPHPAKTSVRSSSRPKSWSSASHRLHGRECKSVSVKRRTRIQGRTNQTRMELTMNNGERIHIDLTSEQQSQIKRLSGKDIAALEFDAEELEQRIAPTTTGRVALQDISITKVVDTSSKLL